VGQTTAPVMKLRGHVLAQPAKQASKPNKQANASLRVHSNSGSAVQSRQGGTVAALGLCEFYDATTGLSHTTSKV